MKRYFDEFLVAANMFFGILHTVQHNYIYALINMVVALMVYRSCIKEKPVTEKPVTPVSTSLKVGDIVFSSFFSKDIMIVSITSDDVWTFRFTDSDTIWVARTPLSHFEKNRNEFF